MLNDNLVKEELQKLINEESLNKKITSIRFDPNEGKYFIGLDNKAKAIVIEEWMEDYLDSGDTDRRSEIIQAIKNAAEWK